jgi:hypothetical protein
MPTANGWQIFLGTGSARVGITGSWCVYILNRQRNGEFRMAISSKFLTIGVWSSESLRLRSESDLEWSIVIALQENMIPSNRARRIALIEVGASIF